jgi:hypothetical protein
MIRHSTALLTACVALAAACAPAATPKSTPDLFLDALRAHCGKAYEGQIINPQPTDSSFAGKQLVMHVRSCGDTVRIPFHVGDDRSRTWVLTRTAEGVRLKHDHRHEDGSEDSVTQYGGDSQAGEGTAERMEFPVDDYTKEMIPYASTNIWTVEITPTAFVYQLRREGSDRRFRVEFDLSREVTPPPAPWGYEDR